MTEAHEERRLVTCVFIDIVGSTDLTVRLGPERLKGALNAAFAEVNARIVAEGGIVEKYIGDAVYALFGAPITHADDPLRALRAAHACRLWAAAPDAPFGLRIGIETGEAIVDLSAVESTHQRMSVGAVVNAAARLEQAAEPGQVLVGPACRAAASGARFRSLGEMSFKGLPPMEVWELEAPGDAPAGVDLPFVGRSSELEILELAHGRSRQRSVLALVSGPPGQGKTRVVRELLERIGRPFRVARFRPAGEVGAGAAWRELLGGKDADRASVVAELGVVADPADRERILRGVLHSAGIASDDALRRLPDEERTDETVNAWRRYLTVTSPAGAPIVWLEDLHWADDASVRIVDRLTRSSGGLFLVATARPEFAQAAGLRPSGDRFFVDLDPLDEGDARALAAHAGAADDVTVGRAQGNPLFIVELARTADHRADLPLTLQGALGARLDELDPSDRQLLSSAAVVGETFDIADAAFLSGREAGEIAPALARLADLLYLRRVDQAYRFHHALLRDVSYGRLLVADRMRIHARLARERGSDMEPERLAHHFWSALHPPDDEWVWTDGAERAALRSAALDAQLAAAEVHLGRYEHAEARDLLEHATSLADTDAARARIDRGRGRLAGLEANSAEAWGLLSRALAFHRRAGDVPLDLYPELLRSSLRLTPSSPERPSVEEIRALFAEGETLAEAGGDLAVLARLQLLRGVIERDVPLARAGIRAAESVLPVADQAAMLAQLAHLQFAVADFAGMTATAARLAELSDLVADPEVAYGPGRRVAVWRGDLGQAQRLTDEIVRRTRTAGPHIRSHSLGLRAWQAEAAGDWPTVRQLVHEFLALALANDGTAFCVNGGTAVLAAGAVAAAREGSFDEARVLLGRARTYIHDPRELHALSIPHAILGDRAGVIPPGAEDRWGWEDYGIACVVLGDPDRAATVLPRLDRWADQGSWLSGATAAAIRDEIEGRGAAGPGHARLRERGYRGPSDILGMRSPGR
ncbi:MAG TPA: AAA family ATPase [Candidatus Saccharimonadales bacterium]|nr:AAA family ATPase [Candidatus Saccharimonadales bacterium]